MSKISTEAMEYIQATAEQLRYGKITVVINENMPDVDIVVENRTRFAKEDTPAPGKLPIRKFNRG